MDAALFPVIGVIAPFTVTVPLVKVKVALFAVVLGLLLLIVRSPEIVKLEMEEVMVVVCALVGVTTMPTLTDAQYKAPEPWIEQAVVVPAKLFKVTALVTVTIIPLFMLRVADAPVKVIDRQVVVTLPVRVTPFGIATSSVEAGTPLGVQVPAVFQLPVVAVLTTACVRDTVDKKINTVKAALRKNLVFIN
jgi:hypothetical protein